MERYYRTLGLLPGASKEDIKKAYKKLAVKYHPDAGGDENHFKEIVKAYELLTGKRQFSRLERQEQFQEEQREREKQVRQQQQRYRAPPPPPVPPKRQLKYVVKEYDRYDTCSTCKGVARVIDDCSTCFSTGNIIGQGNDDVFVRSCKECNSLGYRILFICKDCRGSGRMFIEKYKVGSWE